LQENSKIREAKNINESFLDKIIILKTFYLKITSNPLTAECAESFGVAQDNAEIAEFKMSAGGKYMTKFLCVLCVLTSVSPRLNFLSMKNHLIFS
jgi:hypothetical protein